MKKIRDPLKTDQDDTEKAYLLILKLMNDHKEIESTLWCGAVWSVLINGYISCDFSYEQFLKEVQKLVKHYKHWWDVTVQ
jgi:hypothetical protein